MTLGNLTGVVALTWKFDANGYTAMNLMGAWFKQRCIARGGDAARRSSVHWDIFRVIYYWTHQHTNAQIYNCLLYTSDAADE